MRNTVNINAGANVSSKVPISKTSGKPRPLSSLPLNRTKPIGMSISFSASNTTGIDVTDDKSIYSAYSLG